MPLGSSVNVDAAGASPQVLAAETISTKQYQGILVCDASGNITGVTTNPLSIEEMKPPGYVATNFSTVVAGVTGSTAEALVSLVPTRAAVAGSAATVHTVTASKTFRVLGLSITIANGAASQNGVRIFLRATPTAPATITSPILFMLGVSAPNAVSGGMAGTYAPLDIDIPAGWGFALTQIAAVGSGSVHVHLWGYEYTT